MRWTLGLQLVARNDDNYWRCLVIVQVQSVSIDPILRISSTESELNVNTRCWQKGSRLEKVGHLVVEDFRGGGTVHA